MTRPPRIWFNYFVEREISHFTENKTMALAKIDRDLVLDKIYELRSTVEPNNTATMQKINELIEMIVYTEEAKPDRVYPEIRFRR